MRRCGYNCRFAYKESGRLNSAYRRLYSRQGEIYSADRKPAHGARNGAGGGLLRGELSSVLSGAVYGAAYNSAGFEGRGVVCAHI